MSAAAYQRSGSARAPSQAIRSSTPSRAAADRYDRASPLPRTTKRLARSPSAANASIAVPTPLAAKPPPTKRILYAPGGRPAAAPAAARDRQPGFHGERQNARRRRQRR